MDLSKYPRLVGKPIPIENMSKAYLQNQIERINHVKVNKPYKENLLKELKHKLTFRFKYLK